MAKKNSRVLKCYVQALLFKNIHAGHTYWASGNAYQNGLLFSFKHKLNTIYLAGFFPQSLVGMKNFDHGNNKKK